MAKVTSTFFNGGSGAAAQELITVEAKIGGITKVTPTGSTVMSGLTDGSDTLTSPEMASAQVEVFFGNVPIPSYDQGDGGVYYTKILSDDTITLSQPLAAGDDIKVKIFGPVGSGSGDSLRFGVAGEDDNAGEPRDFNLLNSNSLEIYNAVYINLEADGVDLVGRLKLGNIEGETAVDGATGHGVFMTAVGATTTFLTLTQDSLVIYSDSGRQDGFGSIQQRIVSSGSEAGIGFKNTGSNGKYFNLFSTSASSGLGEGKLVFGDVDGGLDLMHLGNRGVGIGQFDANTVDAALHIRSYGDHDNMFIADKMDFDIRFKMDVDDSFTVSDRATETMKSHLLHLRNEMDTTVDGGYDRDIEFWVNGVVNKRLPRRARAIFNGTITLNQVNTTDISGSGINNSWNNHAMYYIHYRCDASGNVDTLDIEFMHGNDVFQFDNDGEIHIFCDQLEEARHIKCVGTAVLSSVSYTA